MAMFKSITIGQYVPGSSFVHRLDPRTKILGALLLIILLFLVRSFAGYGFAAAFVALVMYVSKIPVRFVLRGLRPLLIIIILTLTLNVFHD